CKMAEPRDKADLTAMLAEGPMIARGAGRAYGDAALQPQLTLSTLHMNRFLKFDGETGELECEAGAML
ncbi:MAG: FAD-binding protein, partial [Pseudomonadota bacterium]